jgi:hypothetical protein
MLTAPQKRMIERRWKEEGFASIKDTKGAISELSRLLTTWELAGELPRLHRPGLLQRLLGHRRIQG